MRNKKKLSDEDVVLAFEKIIAGESLRKVALHFSVHPTTLRERLIRKYGDTYNQMISKHGLLAVVEEYLNTFKSKRDRDIVAEWLSKNKQIIIESDLKSTTNLYTDSKILSLTYNQHYQDYWLENNIRVSA